MSASLVGSEMCIRDSPEALQRLSNGSMGLTGALKGSLTKHPGDQTGYGFGSRLSETAEDYEP
eukprot:8269508-Alexandrium_andersonii.AAC.1